MPTYRVTDPDSGVTLNLTGDSPPSEAELEQIFSQYSAPKEKQITQQPPDIKQVQPEQRFANPRARRAAEIQQRAQLTPLQQAEQERFTQIPEISSTGVSGLTGGTPSDILTTPALLTATDPQEMADILTNTYPFIGVSMQPDGRLFAVNNNTGAVAELNKPGISGTDVLQSLGLASAYFPSSTGSAAAIAAKGGLTGAGLQGLQAATGGEFNTGEVALDVAIPFGIAGGTQIARGVGGAAKRYATGETAEQATRQFGRRGRDFASTYSAKRTAQAERDLVDTISDADLRGVIDQSMPDSRIYQALEEEGISTAPLASYASKNSQYRDVEQALATIPGSNLDAQSREYISEVSKRADDLIQEYGGSLDKNAVSERFRQASTDTIDELQKQASDLYTGLSQQINYNERVGANNIIDFLEQQLDRVGGNAENLSPTLKSLYKKIVKSEGGNPTIGLLDQERKNIGKKLKNPTFVNEDEGLLKSVYGRLAQDQDSAAESIGGAALEMSNAAKALTIQYKQLQGNAIDLLGKDLEKPITRIISGSVKGLPGGGLREFNKRMSQIPQEYRQTVLMSSLNDIFRGRGANAQAFNATQFSKFMDDLNRSTSAKKALYSHLPKEARKSLTNLHRIAKGISDATGQRKDTGRVLALFEPKSGLVSKVMNPIATTAAGVAGQAGGGALGSATARGVVGELLNGKSARAKAAADLLGSYEFLQMLKSAGDRNTVKAAEAKLRNSSAFKRWFNQNQKELKDIGIGSIKTTGALYSYFTGKDLIEGKQ